MADDAKDLVRRFYREITAGKIEAMQEFLADDLAEHEETPGFEPNKKGVLEFFSMLRSAFPDLKMEPHEMISEGDLVCARVTMSGTHRGEFMGIPASNRRIQVQTMDLIRLRDGKCVEHWGVTDTMAMMEQLGAFEGPGGP